MIRARSLLQKTEESSIRKLRGFTIIEAILSVTIFAMVVTACFGVFFYGQQLGANASVKRRAVFLAKEGIEAMRSIRNQTDTLPDEGSYGLTATEAIWQLTETPDVTNDLTRTITVETIDDYTKKITVDITWQHTGTDGSFFMISYLTPWTVTIDDIP